MKTCRLFRCLVMAVCGISPMLLAAQTDSADAARESFLYLRYYAINNTVPYLAVQTKTKVGKAFHAEPGISVKIYLDKEGEDSLLVGRVVTNEKGTATIGLPAKLAGAWKDQHSPTFFAVTDSSSKFSAKAEQIAISKSKLEIDTVNDGEVRSIKGRLLRYENDSLVPMPEVDVRLAVKRSGGNLNIGEEETYTTDSIGVVQGEFMRKELPGDSLGNIELVAMVDDNEMIGTVETRMTVPWGVPKKFESNFNERTLYATGNKAPIWLMVMAYGCIAGVWTVIFYLIYNIVQIRKIGVAGKMKKEN